MDALDWYSLMIRIPEEAPPPECCAWCGCELEDDDVTLFEDRRNEHRGE